MSEPIDLPLKNDLLIRACRRQPHPRTPVWMMRQAGRFLPEYRAVREKYDFITMYKTPELAAEVTLQPVDILGVDAAILFSDILVIPEAMGMALRFEEGRGPLFQEPIRTEEQIEQLREVRPEESLPFVLEAIRLIRRELGGRVPLIGFSGAPWTLATYMVEGQGSKNFLNIKKWRFGNPDALHRLLDRLSRAVIVYLQAQAAAGAQVLQLFDSWAGILDEAGYREFALPAVQKITAALQPSGLPLIYFAKGAGVWLHALEQSGADVLGLDWTVAIGRARWNLKDRFALQGNLDPAALFAPLPEIKKQVRRLLADYGSGEGHIFNLGHGILPTTPVAAARTMVETVQEESGLFHQKGEGND